MNKVVENAPTKKIKENTPTNNLWIFFFTEIEMGFLRSEIVIQQKSIITISKYFNVLTIYSVRLFQLLGAEMHVYVKAGATCVFGPKSCVLGQG